MNQTYVKIEGIHCINCETTIKNSLLRLKNIKKVEFDGDIACISYTKKIDNQKIIDTINDCGYITKEEFISNDIKSLKNNVKLKEFILITLAILLISLLLNKLFGFNIFNAIPTIDSNITFSMLFLTGILTSIHCISMCGAINLMAVINTQSKRNLKNPIIYNIGRVCSYTIIGAIVGFLGSVFNISSKLSGFIILVAAFLMLLMALNLIGIIKLKRLNFCHFKSKSKNVFIVGLLNGFMPCGPLQAMQVFALSTGSALKGALSMFVFGAGTVPLMLSTGILLNLSKGKFKIIINKCASVMILLLSIVMINRGLLAMNIDFFKVTKDYTSFTSSKIEQDYQVVEFSLTYDSYEDIILQKDIPTKIIINVEEKYLTGCNNEIIIEEYNIKQKLKVGKNIIEFTPTKEEDITYKCWMNMIKNRIKIIDDINYFMEDEV